MSVPRCEVAGEIYDVLGSDSGNDRSGTEGEVPDVDNSATQAAHTARIDTKVIRSSKTHQRLRESRNENQGALQVWVKKWTLAPKKSCSLSLASWAHLGTLNSGKDESVLYLEHQCSRLTLYPVKSTVVRIWCKMKLKWKSTSILLEYLWAKNWLKCRWPFPTPPKRSMFQILLYSQKASAVVST